MNAIPQGNSGSRTTVGMRFDKGMSTNFLVPSKFNELNRAKSNEFHAQINSAKSVMAQERASGHLVEAQNLLIRSVDSSKMRWSRSVTTSLVVGHLPAESLTH